MPTYTSTTTVPASTQGPKQQSTYATGTASAANVAGATAGGTKTTGAGAPKGAPVPDPFASSVRLVATRTLTVSGLVDVAGLRYTITRLVAAPGDNSRSTILGDEKYHQGTAIALDPRAVAYDSCQLLFPVTTFIPKYLPASGIVLVIAAGSQWRVEVYA